MSSPLMMQRLHAPLPRGDSVITQPLTRGLASAINSTVETEGGEHQALLSYEAVV
jgi:hypothetical protein